MYSLTYGGILIAFVYTVSQELSKRFLTLPEAIVTVLTFLIIAFMFCDSFYDEWLDDNTI